MFSFSRFVDALFKGAGHKYIKRIPYNTPKGRRYRYIYNVTHSHQGKHAMDESHLKVGTSFMVHTESGAEVHGHIKSISGDRVTYVLDDGADKGKEVTKTKSEIVAMLNEKHNVNEQVQSKRDQLKQQLKTARDNNASEAQIARIQERIDRLDGGRTEEGDLTKLSDDELMRMREKYRKDARSIKEKIHTERVIPERERREQARKPARSKYLSLRDAVEELGYEVAEAEDDEELEQKYKELKAEEMRAFRELATYPRSKDVYVSDVITDEEKARIEELDTAGDKVATELRRRIAIKNAEVREKRKERARVERNKRAREKRAEAKRKKQQQAEREKREQAEREKREQANKPALLELTRPKTGSEMEMRAQRTVDEIINVLQTESRASISQEMVDEILRGVNDTETLDQIETFIEEQHPEQNEDHRLWARISVFRDELMRSK